MQLQHAQATAWASAAVVIEPQTVVVFEDFPSAVPGRWPPAVDHDNSSNIFPLAYALLLQHKPVVQGRVAPRVQALPHLWPACTTVTAHLGP